MPAMAQSAGGGAAAGAGSGAAAAVQASGAEELAALVAAAEAVRRRYEDLDAQWRGSPFSWLLRLPSRRRGAAGEELVARWCEAMGLRVERVGSTGRRPGEADRLIEGRRFEIKFSTLWANGLYVFQQLRDQDYQYVFCLGVSPADAHAWVLPKPLAWSHAVPQHGGRAGRDTRWLHVDPARPETWLRPWGGSLAEARAVLLRELGMRAREG